MDCKPWFVLVTHGRFGEELKNSAEMIMGPLEDTYCISLMEGMDPLELKDKLAELLKDAPTNTIIMTDLFGGTPSNTAAMFAFEKEYSIICGLNLPMLIETYASRMSMETAHEIATHVTEVARDGVKPKPETLEPKKEEKAAGKP